MKHPLNRYLSVIVSSLVAFVFILAAVSKLTDMALFQKTVEGLTYLPVGLQKLTVACLPGVEIVVGLCLLCRIAIREASVIAGCLMVGFLWLSIHTAVVGSMAGCGCFKIVAPAVFTLTGWWIVARDFLIMLGCQYLVIHMRDNLPGRKME